jgi:lipopolysaccharide heptosyltransferase II
MRSPAKRAAALAADAVLSATAPFLVRRSMPSRLPASPRVLLIRCDHIGDAVMATAVLRRLREVLRPATLDVLAGPWASSVFEGHPAVDNVLTYATPWWCAARGASRRERFRRWVELPRVVRRIRAARYDVGIDLRGDLRQIAFFLALGGMPTRVSSDRTGGRRLLTHVWRHDASLHEVEKNVAIATALLGVSGDGCAAVDLAMPVHSSHGLSTLVRAVHDNGYAVLAPHASESRRRWPATHAAAFVDALHGELGLDCVLVGSGADTAACDAIAELAATPVVNLAGRTSLSELTSVLGGATVTIAVDSGPMHLAAAAGSPVVALFGPTDPRLCRPWSGRAHIVSTAAPCGCAGPPCRYTRGPGRCMHAIEPGAVLVAVRRALADRTAPTV